MLRSVAPAALALACLAAPARAEPTAKQRAKYEQAFRRGNLLFEEKQWAKARAEFEAAYEIDPKPLLLFNIASTYRREGDRVNARVYYKWYLDKADDPKLADLARATIAELDASAAEAQELQAKKDALEAREQARAKELVATPAPVQAKYPRAEIDRPWTLPRGTFAATLGGGVFPRFELPMFGVPETTYEPFAIAVAAVGVSDRVQLAVEADVGVTAPGRSFLLGSLSIGAYHGARGAVAVGTSLGYSAASGEVAFASVGAQLRYKLGDRLAIVSTEDQLLVEVDDDNDVALRLPVGLAVQLAPTLYAAVSTRLAAFDRDGAGVLFGGFRYGMLELVATPHAKLDVVVRWRAYDEGTDGALAVRYRL